VILQEWTNEDPQVVLQFHFQISALVGSFTVLCKQGANFLNTKILLRVLIRKIEIFIIEVELKLIKRFFLINFIKEGDYEF